MIGVIADLTVGMLAAAVPADTPFWERVAIGAGGAAIFLVLLAVIGFPIAILYVPYKQRNQAWRVIEELTPDDPFTIDVQNETSGTFVNQDPNECYSCLGITVSRRIENVEVFVESFTILMNGHEVRTTNFQPRRLQWSSFRAKKSGPRGKLNISPGDPPAVLDVVAVNRNADRPVAMLITKDRFAIPEQFSIVGICISSDSPDKGTHRTELLVRQLPRRGSIGNMVHVDILTPELRAQALEWSKPTATR